MYLLGFESEVAQTNGMSSSSVSLSESCLRRTQPQTSLADVGSCGKAQAVG
jgi:hypothetical protein